MKISAINSYNISFKNNPTSEPAQPTVTTASVVPTNIPTDTVQFQSSVKVKKSATKSFIDFVRDFAKTPTDVIDWNAASPEEIGYLENAKML